MTNIGVFRRQRFNEPNYCVLSVRDPTPGHVNVVYPFCDNKDHCGTARFLGLSDPA